MSTNLPISLNMRSKKPGCFTVSVSFANKVKEIRTSSFGKQVVLELPDWADVVILCYNKYGLKPFNLCLPHQIYVDKLEKAIEGKGAVAITAIPARASEYVDIACL